MEKQNKKIIFIYQIRCSTTGDIYIGSTRKTLRERLTQHKADYKRYLNGKYCYVTSFEILKNNNYTIEQLEQFENIDKKQIEKIEGEYIKKNVCVNKFIPGRTDKEYREHNKDVIKEQKREYYEHNRDKINQKIVCVCGSKYTHHHESRHIKSQKHQKHILNQNPV